MSTNETQPSHTKTTEKIITLLDKLNITQCVDVLVQISEYTNKRHEAESKKLNDLKEKINK